MLPPQQPLVSVVLPNYNHASTLDRALNAILKESAALNGKLQLIVIDDASTDESIKVLRDFADRYKLLLEPHFHCENHGVVYCMNEGLSLAEGKYVYFAAADDFILPGLLSESVKLLEEFPRAPLCFSQGVWKEKSLEWVVAKGLKPGYISPTEIELMELQGKLYIPSHTTVFRKTCLNHFQVTLRSCCDWYEIYTKAFLYGACHIDKPLGVMHLNHGYFRQQRAGNYNEILKRLAGQLTCSRLANSGAFYVFGFPMLRVLLKHYPEDINLIYLRKLFIHEIKRFGKNILLRFV